MKTQNPNNPNNPNNNNKNVYHIGGIPVEFPYKPYGTQLAFMARVISTLDRAHRESHCHALLESPTGTGKSLSLLCSALAWQRHRKLNQPPPQPDPRAASDPVNHGGGFLPDSQLSETLTPEGAPPATNGKVKKKAAPTIFYASRTHSQLSQVIREYRKTTYRVPMAILASRKHYCTNSRVRNADNLDEECKLLLQDKENGCLQFKNAHKVKNHPSIQKGGCHEAHDIEDLVKVGKRVKGCSYFAALSMAYDAEIVFCPYSYIVNPVIRRAMDVDIKGAVLILDEAHNIEDMSREAGSMEVDEEALQRLQTELGQLCGGDALTYQPLYEMVQDLLSWMERRKTSLEKREFQHYFSCWTGDKALRELQEANISQQCFPILQECATKAVRAASDTESGMPHLSGLSALTLEGLFCSLSYFFQGNGVHIHDYQLVVQRFFSKNTGSWTLTCSLWCLNPAVVFRDIADLSMSVILTSGTLSPMNSFSSELGIQFGTLLEAPHVIDAESQVWASVISTGPHDYPLNASYKTADGYAFQDALGKSLEELFKVVPGGSLVFFPSYKLMDKLCKRWRETGQWSHLNAKKSLFVEPRGGNQEEFDAVLKGYYTSVRNGTKPSLKKKRTTEKVDSNACDVTGPFDACKAGAAFLAVFRGKVSEGIDFSDDNARAVIMVGIPFPNIHDLQIAEKKKFNDTYRLSKSLLNGSDWYCHQAFRALNQAAGRCIRHKSDYGAVIFLDERFREERNTTHISKWLRKSIKTYENFEKSVEELRSFFSKIKVTVEDANSDMLQEPVNDLENIPQDNSGSRLTKQKSQKSEIGKKRMVLGDKMMTSGGLSHCPSLKADGSPCMTMIPEISVEIQESSLAYSEYMDTQKVFDANCNSGLDSRCQETPCSTSVDDSLELSVVKETPTTEGSNLASPEASMNDNNSHSTIVQISTGLGHTQYASLTGSARYPSAMTCSEVTPERIAREHTKGSIQEMESSANMSVNSRAQKRRALWCSSGVNLFQEMNYDVATTGISRDSRMCCSVENGCLHQNTEVGVSMNTSECELKSSVRLPSQSSDLLLDERLQIFCSLCRNPLGIPENNSYVTCSLTTLSKGFLTALYKQKGQQCAQTAPSALPVLIVDKLAVDRQLFNKHRNVISAQGIWCHEDGCVYNTIFCPFCFSSDNCLGVHIMATDASNIQLVDKILFYYDGLEVKINNGLNRKDSLVDRGSSPTQIGDINSIGKYAYQSPQQSSGGWRMTKTKSKLQKKSSVSQF